jgi:glyoxylase-like metal-dependent hydrolase (beta-lactamase superfamily II)
VHRFALTRRGCGRADADGAPFHPGRARRVRGDRKRTIETRDSAGVIINADDVFLVDTNITPEGDARASSMTSRPSPQADRYVVNTHWHYDHADGNQIFGPEVTIIGIRTSGRLS